MSLAAHRAALLERAFLDTSWSFLGRRLRPVTILSLELCHQLGVGLLKNAGDFAALPLATQTRAVAVFVFLHTESWEAALNAVREGDVPGFDEVKDAPHVCASFCAWLLSFQAQVEAASFEPRLRRGYERETPPDDLAPTCWLSDMVDEIAARYHWSEDFILRALPFVRAVQYHHHCLAARPHLWTTRKGRKVSEQVKALDAVALTLAALPQTDEV